MDPAPEGEFTDLEVSVSLEGEPKSGAMFGLLVGFEPLGLICFSKSLRNLACLMSSSFSPVGVVWPCWPATGLVNEMIFCCTIAASLGKRWIRKCEPNPSRKLSTANVVIVMVACRIKMINPMRKVTVKPITVQIPAAQRAKMYGTLLTIGTQATASTFKLRGILNQVE